jgi:hypothetical protein
MFAIPFHLPCMQEEVITALRDYSKEQTGRRLGQGCGTKAGGVRKATAQRAPAAGMAAAVATAAATAGGGTVLAAGLRTKLAALKVLRQAKPMAGQRLGSAWIYVLAY